MGMIIHVCRAIGYDCTLEGISKRFDEFVAVNVEGPFEPDDKRPAVKLEQHVPGALRIVPADIGGRWAMFGGNYASTSDGRFSAACEKLLGHRFYGAVAVHDRFES